MSTNSLTVLWEGYLILKADRATVPLSTTNDLSEDRKMEATDPPFDIIIHVRPRPLIAHQGPIFLATEPPAERSPRSFFPFSS